jgi:hypothetical protein
MGEQGGPRRHCRAFLLPRAALSRTRSVKGWKCHTTPVGRWRIPLLHPMPWKNDCTLRRGPMLGRPSHVSRPLQPRCAAGSIRGTAPARWPDRKIRRALSSQGLTYASASKDFLAPIAIAARNNIFTMQAVKHGRFAVSQQQGTDLMDERASFRGDERLVGYREQSGLGQDSGSQSDWRIYQFTPSPAPPPRRAAKPEGAVRPPSPPNRSG